MRTALSLFLLLVFLSSTVHAQHPDKKVMAKQLVERSIQAMGEEGWRSVKSLALSGYGYQNQIDESERSEGPYIPVQIQRNIISDRVNSHFLVNETKQSYDFGDKSTFLINGENIAAKTEQGLQPIKSEQELRDELNLSPDIVLKKALASPDIVYIKDTLFQKTENSVLSFKDSGYPVRLFLDKHTSLISAVEIVKPFNDDFSNIWGDIKKTIIYSFWMVLGKGIHYPLQYDTYLNNWYKESFLFTKWKVNPELSIDSLIIPAKIKEQEQMLAKNEMDGFKKAMEQGAKQIEPGVWFLPGICNSTVVSQPDGIVVIESPYSSTYGEMIIEKVHTLFPHKKIKALISTSDAWLHIGGMRAFATIPGLKMYHPAHNRPLINKLLKAPFKTQPDVLAKTPNPSYSLNGVTDTLTIGSGDNQLILYHYQTETGDRQMMAYFPHYKLVYTSDLYQGSAGQGKYWNPQIIWEVYHSIKSRKINVEQFYSTHSKGLLSFKDLEKDVLNEIR